MAFSFQVERSWWPLIILDASRVELSRGAGFVLGRFRVIGGGLAVGLQGLAYGFANFWDSFGTKQKNQQDQ